MKVELLNLVEAKRIAGDANWINEQLVIHLLATSESVREAVRNHLAAHGFTNVLIWEMAGPKVRLEACSHVLKILIRKDYDKLTLGPPPEAEHKEILDTLIQVLQHQELCAKIQVSIYLHKP